jgi:hypothetical protein
MAFPTRSQRHRGRLRQLLLHQLVRGRGREVAPMMYAAALAFVVYFALPLIQRLLHG